MDNPGFVFSTDLFAPPVTDPNELRIRNEFIAHYLDGYNPLEACLRMGIAGAFAQECAKNFMVDPYVCRGIAAGKLATPAVEDIAEQERKDRALVLSVLRRNAQNGPPQVQVAAASKLATIYQMDKPETEADAAEAVIRAMQEFAAKVPV